MCTLDFGMLFPTGKWEIDPLGALFLLYKTES